MTRKRLASNDLMLILRVLLRFTRFYSVLLRFTRILLAFYSGEIKRSASESNGRRKRSSSSSWTSLSGRLSRVLWGHRTS